MFILLDEIDISAIRAQGAGGQNVSKVSGAVHPSFDIKASSLPGTTLSLGDQRISKKRVGVIKAQELCTLAGNRAEALRRLERKTRRIMAKLGRGRMSG